VIDDIGSATSRRGVKGVIFDLDGTLVRGADALPGALETVAQLRARGLKLVFCTQDSVNPPDHVAAKLQKIGFGATRDEVMCAGFFGGEHLAETYPDQPMFAICSPDLRRVLLSHGVDLVEPHEAKRAKVVFVARDPALLAEQVAAACTAIWNGATFYAFGHDPVIPVAGRNAPGAGAIVVAIEFTTRQKALVLGKPSKPLAHAALKRLGAEPHEAIVVGDSLISDIPLGKGVGAGGLLVLTGGSTADQAARAEGLSRPDAVLASVADLPGWLFGG
jgi:HAD superfamily hydrolase (TIGR01450 family)